MTKIILSLVALVMLSGCSHKLQRFEDIDRENKTVLVPAGNFGLGSYLKEVLREDEFELFIRSSEKDAAYMKKDLAKYDLIFDAWWQGENLFTGNDKYKFSISFVDLKTDKEVFIYSGLGWGKKIQINLKKILNNQDIRNK